jgi:hypothetical protein
VQNPVTDLRGGGTNCQSLGKWWFLLKKKRRNNKETTLFCIPINTENKLMIYRYF